METPTMKKNPWIPFPWLFTWRFARRALIIFGSLVTLIALCYAEENWRGRHALNQYKAELKVRGETLNLAELAPPAIPDDQNMAMHPLWKGLFNRILDPVTKTEQWIEIGPFTNQLFFTERKDDPRDGILTFGNWTITQKISLEQYQVYYRTPDTRLPIQRRETASVLNEQSYYRGTNRTEKFEFPVAEQPQSPGEDVLLAMTRNDPGLALVRESAQRLLSRFPINYDKTFEALLPHLSRIRGATQVLRIRSLAELSLNQTDKALTDVQLAYRLIDSTRTEPFLITHLVRLAMNTLILQPVWEGLADHRWNEAQLIALDRDLAALDFLKDYQVSMHGERACIVSAMESILRNRKENRMNIIDNFMGGSDDLVWKYKNLAFLLIPSGWFDRNTVSCAQLMSDSIQCVDVEKHSLRFDNIRSAKARFDAFMLHKTLVQTVSSSWMGGLLSEPGSSVKRFAWAQNAVDMARIACNLERYRLANGSYPEKLEVLVPKFMTNLPNDVINGKPLNYLLQADGTFILYSVGWNQKDDGGEVGLVKTTPPKRGKAAPPRQNMDEGDWVWRY